MRPAERIDPILSKLDLEKFLRSFGKTFRVKTIKTCVKLFNDNKDKLKKYWLDNPDLRLTQLLVNSGILPNMAGPWYYTEEVDFYIKHNILKARDILFWGTFGKKGKGPLKQVAIKNMSAAHIKACLKNVPNMKESYKKAMERELDYRSKKKSKTK